MIDSHKGKCTLRNGSSELESPDIESKGPVIFLINQVY